MNTGDMKNIVVLKNLPSNLVEEAIVVLKENKKVRKYQYVDTDKSKIKEEKEKSNGKQNNKQEEKNAKEYIIKEAEMLISDYINKLETKSPKWKNNMKKLEKRYKNSLKLNFILGLATVISLIISLI